MNEIEDAVVLEDEEEEDTVIIGVGPLVIDVPRPVQQPDFRPYRFDLRALRHWSRVGDALIVNRAWLESKPGGVWAARIADLLTGG